MGSNIIFMKYNYVILGSCEDYYKIAYAQLDNFPGVKCVMDYIDSSSRILKNIFRLHNSIKLNNIIQLPFRCIWYPYIFKDEFKDNKPLCIILFARNSLFSFKYIRYLRSNFKECKIVVFWQDLVKTDIRHDIIKINDKVDLAFTFDQSDAKKYGMIYHPSVYSPYDCDESISLPQSDVFFLGKAKDRLDVIIKSFEKFRDNGLKCDFFITGVNSNDRIYNDEINYCDRLPYLENIRHVKATKCILEIMQGDASGYTFRMSEAIMYDKRIITNNREIVNSDFFDPRFIQQFKEPENIDVAFVKSNDAVFYPQKENILPSKFLEIIDKML